LPKQEKIEQVAEIREKLENCRIAIVSQYQGLNVAQATDLRRKLREADVDYKVYKNTLARRALQEMDLEGAVDFMEGPTAWAFCEDPVLPAKILKEFAKTSEKIAMSGAILNGEILTRERLQALADLPSREQLLAQTVGTIAAPLRNFAGVLSAVPRNMVNVLDQIRRKKEEEGAPEAA
jgi:large subunit ribosomal protein L10